MSDCIADRFRIVEGGIGDLRRLERFHYRGPQRSPTAAIFALKPAEYLPEIGPDEAVGVIAYAHPVPAVAMRNQALGGYLSGLGRAAQMAVINRDIRCISRVIIDPRLRSLGLASRLVRETMGLLKVPIIEARAAMGLVHPFFERAGMRPYPQPTPVRSVRLAEALATVGINSSVTLDAERTQRMLDALDPGRAGFIESEIRLFLKPHGKRRNMPAGIERTRFVLSRLGEPGVYYLWLNPEHTARRNTQPPQKPTIPAAYLDRDEAVAAIVASCRGQRCEGTPTLSC